MSDPKRKPGEIDQLGFRDKTDVGLSGYVPPNYPCPICKGESKDSGIKGWRVCCDQSIYVGLTEKELLDLMDEVTHAKARVQQFEIMYKAADKELTDALRMLRERGII